MTAKLRSWSNGHTDVGHDELKAVSVSLSLLGDFQFSHLAQGRSSFCRCIGYISGLR